MSVSTHVSQNEPKPPPSVLVHNESAVTASAACVPEEMECTQLVDTINDSTCSESVVELDTTTNNNNSRQKNPQPLGWLKVISFGASPNVPQDLPRILPLLPGVTTFGRDSASNFQFKLPSLSRNHASIEAIGRGGNCFLLTDLGSRNGTQVNKKRLPANEKHVLNMNNTVTFGDVELQLLFEDPSKVDTSSDSVKSVLTAQSLTQSNRKRKLQNQIVHEGITPQKLENSLKDSSESSSVCPISSSSKKPSVQIVEPKHNRLSMFFADSPRTSMNVFDESKINESGILDLNRNNARPYCLVEETFCDVDPDNNDYDEEESETEDQSCEYQTANAKRVIVNETCHDLNLANYKFKDESSKSLSNSNGSSKRNSIDMNFEAREDSPAGNSLMKDLQRKIIDAKCVKESPLVKISETISFGETVLSVGETPEEESIERKKGDDTVIVSETISSYENLALMSPASRNTAFNPSASNSAGSEQVNASSYERVVIAETCFDVTNSHELSNGCDSKAEDDLLEGLDKEAEKQQLVQKNAEHKMALDQNSPESVPDSPSMFNLPPEENNLSDDVYGLKSSAEDPLVSATSLTPASSDNKVADVQENDKVYDEDTLDLTGCGDDVQVNNSQGKVEEQNDVTIFNDKEPVDVKKPKSSNSQSSKVQLQERRPSLEDLGFSDDDDDSVNGSSIVTSSQRELANKTISSINTPMKQRLKRRKENTQKQKMTDKRMAKTADIVEEIAATFDDNNFDSVNGLKDLQLEVSAIESISKRSATNTTNEEENDSNLSKTSSKASKKPRGRGRATKNAEISHQQLSQQFDILPGKVQSSDQKLPGQQQSDESKKVKFENDTETENGSIDEPLINLKKEFTSQKKENDQNSIPKDEVMQSKRKRGARRALIMSEVSSKGEEKEPKDADNSSEVTSASSKASRTSRSSRRTTKTKSATSKSKADETLGNGSKTAREETLIVTDKGSQQTGAHLQTNEQLSSEQFDKELNDMVGCDDKDNVDDGKQEIKDDPNGLAGYSDTKDAVKSNKIRESAKLQSQLSVISNVDTIAPSLPRRGRKKAGTITELDDLLPPIQAKETVSQVAKTRDEPSALIEPASANLSSRSRRQKSSNKDVAEDNERLSDSNKSAKRGRGTAAKVSIKEEPNTTVQFIAEEEIADQSNEQQASVKKQQRAAGRPQGAKNKVNVQVKTEEELSSSPVGKRNSPRKKIDTSDLYSSPKSSPRKGKKMVGAPSSSKKSKLKDTVETEEGSAAEIKKEPDNPKSRKRGAAASGKSASKASGSSSSSVSSDHSCKSPKRSRSIGGQPTYVMFTGISDKDVAKYTKQLRASIGPSCQFGDDCSQCVYLVTDKIRRTKKFLCTLARGVNIVGVKWVEACDKAKSLVDAAGYILSDKENEAKFEMSLEQSILSARENKGILKELRIHVTPSVEPTPAEMKEIVTSAGGTILPRIPVNAADKNTIIVTAEKDRSKLKSGLLSCCKTKEFVLCAIMKQLVELEKHCFE